MKIFLDCANPATIARLLPTGLIDGITTNPSNLSHEKEPRAALAEICVLLRDKPVSIEVTEKSPEDVYRQAKEIARIAPNVVVKIPCSAQYYPVIKKLADEHIVLNITLVFTLAQGLMMSKLGVTYISPFVGRWDDIDVDGAQLLYELRAMKDQYQFKTEILAASLRNLTHLHAAIQAGADVATLPVELFEKSLDHILTKQGMEKFATDWAKLAITKFP